MRTSIIAIASALLLTACSGIPTSKSAPTETAEATASITQTESQRLTEWLDAKYKEQLEFSPISKTFLGIKDDAYSEIDDFSPEAETKQLEWLRASVD